MQSWLRTFESGNSYRLRIFGHGDCSGTNRANEGIRRGRAEQMERILGPAARLRVVLRDMAALGVSMMAIIPLRTAPGIGES
jgi:hypothetical protein